MKRPLMTLIRIALLFAYVLIMIQVLSSAEAISKQTFRFMPYYLLAPSLSILFGAVLRSDVFFKAGYAFRADWFSLILIGLSSLLCAFSSPLIMWLIPNQPLPGFFAVFLFRPEFPMISGVIFGYTIVNSLFEVKKV